MRTQPGRLERGAQGNVALVREVLRGSKRFLSKGMKERKKKRGRTRTFFDSNGQGQKEKTQ